MATIEERAGKYAMDKCCTGCEKKCKGVVCAKVLIRDVDYRIGATEQRKIDIEKACDFMRNFTLPNGVAPLYDYTGNLVKAMEE